MTLNALEQLFSVPEQLTLQLLLRQSQRRFRNHKLTIRESGNDFFHLFFRKLEFLNGKYDSEEMALAVDGVGFVLVTCRLVEPGGTVRLAVTWGVPRLR